MRFCIGDCCKWLITQRPAVNYAVKSHAAGALALTQVNIVTRPMPDMALLARYRAPGNYVDCLCADVDGSVDIASFAVAFLTSRAFRLERWLLGALLGKRSSDGQAAELATGAASQFAAWTVEARSSDQLLLRDFLGHTRSWLMTEPIMREGAGAATRLHFGTAVVHIGLSGFARTRAVTLFWLLLPFHKIYARVLLGSAVRRLISQTAS